MEQHRRIAEPTVEHPGNLFLASCPLRPGLGGLGVVRQRLGEASEPTGPPPLLQPFLAPDPTPTVLGSSRRPRNTGVERRQGRRWPIVIRSVHGATRWLVGPLILRAVGRRGQNRRCCVSTRGPGARDRFSAGQAGHGAVAGIPLGARTGRELGAADGTPVGPADRQDLLRNGSPRIAGEFELIGGLRRRADQRPVVLTPYSASEGVKPSKMSWSYKPLRENAENSRYSAADAAACWFQSANWASTP